LENIGGETMEMNYFDNEKITDNMSDILHREYKKYQI
jgi:hypothetical protein